MSGLTYSVPPAQVNVRVVFRVEGPRHIEHLIRWSNLEHQLCADPMKLMLPLRLSKHVDIEPGPTTYDDFKIDWSHHFAEDMDFMVFIPEPSYKDIAYHCSLAFPANLIQCGGPGRVTTCDLRLKPLSTIEISTAMHELDRRLGDTRRELRQVLRRLEMVETNLCLATQATLSLRPDMVSRLHAETPERWLKGITEEY